MITLLRYPKGYQFFDANGAPLALGTLSYFVAGSTSPQDTYSDSGGTVVNPNPIVLDGSGRLPVDVYLGPNAGYKEVLAASSAVISPWPDDNIPPAWQADWNAVSGPGAILNKPALAAVAFSGSYTDLADVPPTQSPFTGDSGSGGTAGLVPAPSAGDAAAGMFLSASGGWAVPPSSSSSAAPQILTTNAATASGAVLNFASVPSTIAVGMAVADTTTPGAIPPGAIVTATASTTVTLSAAVAGSGVASGDTIAFYASSSNTNLGVSETGTSVAVTSSTGSGITIPAATHTAAGVLDAARAAKIDGLATVASSGSYADLSNKPTIPSYAPFTGASGTANGSSGLVPAPSAGQQGDFLRGDGTWAAAGPSGGTPGGTNGQVQYNANGAFGGFTVSGDATLNVATGALTVAATNGAPFAKVATSGSYTDLSNTPTIPSYAAFGGATASAAGTTGLVPAPAAGNQGYFLRGDATWQTDLDNIGRLGIGTTDTGNAFSFKGPTALFANTGDIRVTMSKGAASNTAAVNFQDNFSTRVQFGLLGNDSFTIATSPDGSTFNNAIVATTAGAVSFPNTGGFAGATSSAAGTTGLVPAPAAGQQASLLAGSGVWLAQSALTLAASQVSGLGPLATAGTGVTWDATNQRLALTGYNFSPGFGSGAVLSITNQNDGAALELVPSSGGNALVVPSVSGGAHGLYINNSGAIYTQAWVTISGTASGSGLGLSISPPSSDALMLGMWADVGTVFQSRVAQGTPGSGASPAGAAWLHSTYLDRNGHYVYSVQETGSHHWQAAGSSYAADTSLSRIAAGVLAVGNGAVGNATGAVQAGNFQIINNGAYQALTTSSSLVNLLQLDNGNNIFVGSGSNQGQLTLVGGNGIYEVRCLDHTQTISSWRALPSNGKMAIGNADNFDGTLTIMDGTGGGDTTICVRDGTSHPARFRFGTNGGTYDTGLSRIAPGMLAVTDGAGGSTNYQNLTVAALYSGANQVVGARIGGYGTPTGNAYQPSFSASTITLANLAACVAQLIVDLKTHGLIGS